MSGRPPAKYAPLARYLAQQPAAVSEVTLTLAEIEQLLGTALPLRARGVAWWHNSRTAFHARVWLGVGWRTQRKTLWSSQPTVTFVREECGR